MKTGHLSGRMGPLVAYVTKDGRQHFRSYVHPADPCTPKQLACRMKLGLVNHSLSPLNKVIKQGYPGEVNAYRRLVGKACREAVEGEYPDFRFNYGKIQIARGMLPLPANARVEYDATTREARFTWDAPLTLAPLSGSDNDRVTIVCLHADRFHDVITLHAGTRDTGSAAIVLPGHWQAAQTHYWLYLTSHDRQEISNSIYLA